MAIDPVFAATFDCDTCAIDCKGGPLDFPNGLWRVDFCLSCDGKNLDCPVCKGSSATPVWSCPRTMAGRWESTLLPYFFDWRTRSENGSLIGKWPDGRGRLFQDVRLVRAFETLERVMKTRGD